MQIVRGRAPESTPTQSRTETFTGTVWGDPVLPTTAEGNTIDSVTFMAGARTYWHHHTNGQILVVTAGRGWVCPRGEEPQLIRAGDVVWVPPGEQHWHGGTGDTIMTHLAVSLGPTVWLDEVSEEEYAGSSSGWGAAGVLAVTTPSQPNPAGRRPGFVRSGLEQTVESLRAVAAAIPTGHPDRAFHLRNLALALWARYERTGAPADLEQTIELLRAAVADASADRPNWVVTQSDLALTLWTRYERTGAPADLEQAIELLRAVVADVPADHPDRATHLSDLALAVWEWWRDSTGAPEGLEQAIELLRAVLADLPADHPDRAIHLHNLALALRARYDGTGERADLERAIALLRAVVADVPADDPNRATVVSDLAAALEARHRRTGRPADLDEAIELQRGVVVPAGHPGWSTTRRNPTLRALQRYERTGAPVDPIRITRQTGSTTDVMMPDHIVTPWGEPRPAGSAPRHVNLWLARPPTGTAIPAGTRLAAGTGYLLRLSIGPLAEESVVQDAKPFPDEHLPPSEQGHWLEVAVVSFTFGVPDRRHPVFLPAAGSAWVCPCPPGGAHSCTPAARAPFLEIPVLAPPEPGSGQIRVAVYFAKNLVQSLMLTAEVAAAEEPAVSGPGISAVVDFTLSTGLTNMAALPARTLNILTNDDAPATHTIVFNGAHDDVVAFRLTEGQMTDAISAVRVALRDIHLEEYGGQFGATRQLRNRYDGRNAKSRAEFEADLRRLAPLGRKLWDVLLSDKPERRRRLHQTVLTQPSLIQVGRTGASGFVFPWALVYDIPLEPGNPAAWKPCPTLSTWEPTIDAPDGAASGVCPREDAHTLNTICPFGFWGYRHQIEAPPSVPEGRTLTLAVTVDAPPPEAVVAVSTNLDQALTTTHLRNLTTALAGFDVRRTDTRAALATRLEEPALELVYLYCHGRRQDVAGAEPQPYLEVGDGEVLAPGDLGAWFDAVWPPHHWTTTAPLVFINGCHTAEITPRTLVQFVDAFTGVYAAGVVGTETTVHQQVAGEVAETFWRELATGATVGRALQAARLRLLRKGNLMGLAYTAYCSLDLRLVGLAR